MPSLTSNHAATDSFIIVTCAYSVLTFLEQKNAVLNHYNAIRVLPGASQANIAMINYIDFFHSIAAGRC